MSTARWKENRLVVVWDGVDLHKADFHVISRGDRDEDGLETVDYMSRNGSRGEELVDEAYWLCASVRVAVGDHLEFSFNTGNSPDLHECSGPPSRETE